MEHPMQRHAHDHPGPYMRFIRLFVSLHNPWHISAMYAALLINKLHVQHVATTISTVRLKEWFFPRLEETEYGSCPCSRSMYKEKMKGWFDPAHTKRDMMHMFRLLKCEVAFKNDEHLAYTLSIRKVHADISKRGGIFLMRGLFQVPFLGDYELRASTANTLPMQGAYDPSRLHTPRPAASYLSDPVILIQKLLRNSIPPSRQTTNDIFIIPTKELLKPTTPKPTDNIFLHLPSPLVKDHPNHRTLPAVKYGGDSDEVKISYHYKPITFTASVDKDIDMTRINQDVVPTNNVFLHPLFPSAKDHPAYQTWPVGKSGGDSDGVKNSNIIKYSVSVRYRVAEKARKRRTIGKLVPATFL
ncbi:hypothetical protein BDQ17DRAFT_1344718 [Cyathus striatus]|nr:hypothetical protein BDQ17DRAFT_1344718 [Cyathus striatus]